MDLVERTCISCGLVKFRVLPTSTRETCSDACATDGMSGKEKKAFYKKQFSPQPAKRGRKPLTEEERAIRMAAKRTADSLRKKERYATDPEYRAKQAANKRAQYARDPEGERARKRAAWAAMPEDVKKNETQPASPGPAPTENLPAPHGGHGMSETEDNRTQRPSSANAVEILPAASPPSSKALRQELLAHDGLLKASSTHLFGLMKGLVHNHPDPSCQRIDPDIAHATTGLASQLVKLSKLRLEGIKLAQELKKGK